MGTSRTCAPGRRDRLLGDMGDKFLEQLQRDSRHLHLSLCAWGWGQKERSRLKEPDPRLPRKVWKCPLLFSGCEGDKVINTPCTGGSRERTCLPGCVRPLILGAGWRELCKDFERRQSLCHRLVLGLRARGSPGRPCARRSAPWGAPASPPKAATRSSSPEALGQSRITAVSMLSHREHLLTWSKCFKPNLFQNFHSIKAFKKIFFSLPFLSF